MNRALKFVVPAVLIALVAIGAPIPFATRTADRATVVTVAAASGTSMVMQCPGGAVWYRSFSAAELAAADGVLHYDGGFFGVLADFRTQGDPVGIVLGSGAAGLAVNGIADAGAVVCTFSTP